jgi:aerobic-type carbon monoxide dehydrogenase small subunit (CoxS/CutS family)
LTAYIQAIVREFYLLEDAKKNRPFTRNKVDFSRYFTIIQRMKEEFRLQINGSDREIQSHPDRSLLDVLREDLDLTGAKYGCGEGQCRACTVLVNGEPVPSCLTSVQSVKDLKIETIEGLSREGQLHPVQQAFIDQQAMQCGYCVPGMILSTVALLRKNASPNRDEIVQGLNGNLCRCCGYPNLIKAVHQLADSASRKEIVK